MVTIKNLAAGLALTLLATSCSVQQFAVNTQHKPFEKGGKWWGERTEKCGEGGWRSEFVKDSDIHIIGINIKKSNTAEMVNELQASSYTIETKSNLIAQFLTFGIVDYKIVKVIKRDN